MNDGLSRVVVTSFNAAGFERYGARMVDSFRRYWPPEVEMVVVSEDDIPLETDERVRFESYGELAPEGEHFKRKFGQFPLANGKRFEVLDDENMMMEYLFPFDAIRFSHKSFSIFGVSRKWDSDRLIWLDGDTVTFKPIDDRFFAETDPGDGHASYLGRNHMYSECGFICYNRRHTVHHAFMNQIAEEYFNGEIFLLPQWHDCWVFDIMREHFARTEGAAYRNLSADVADSDHPFINCVLGEYMDHLKGEERKEAGRSFDEDLVNNEA